jgi:probable rRNA maturation factor
MIEVEVEDAEWTRALPDAAPLARAAAKAALSQAGAPRDRDHLVVLLTDDETVHALNARFRGRDKPTNVLSFPAATTAGPHLGDIALACAVCVREADEQGKRLADHLQHLVVHGALHLLGYDHLAEAEAEVMEALERRILAGLGAPDPYGAGEGARHG